MTERRALRYGAASVLAGLAALAAATPAPAATRTVDVSGNAYDFSRPTKPLAGATVSVAEHPRLRTTVRANGSYRLAVPARGRVTPTIREAGYHRIYLQTFTMGGRDLRRVNFQVPPDATYDALAALLEVPLDANGDVRRCAIVSTLNTRKVRTLSFARFLSFGAHGVAGATASASPSLGKPIYFNESVIPDRTQKRSSKDGGVIWTGVPAGRYVIRAGHPHTRFARFTATCKAGRVVNASPPWGLHELGR